MVIKIVVATMVFLSCLPKAWATPPISVTITYDLNRQVLHIDAPHPSDKLDKHYLRKVQIYLNGKEAATVFYPRQKLPSGLAEDISFAAEAGDNISVELTCSQGGIGKASLDISKPPEELKASQNDQKNLKK